MITEPYLLIFRRASWRIASLRIARLMLFLIALALGWRFIGGPLTMTTVGFLTLAAFASFTLTLIPRKVTFTDDHVSMRLYWIWVENAINETTKPILLRRPLSNDLSHVVFIFPTGSVNLLRIVPLFDLIVRQSDMAVLDQWADPESVVADGG